LVTSCSSTSGDVGIDTPDPGPAAGTFRIADEHEQRTNIVDCINYDTGVTTIELVMTRPVVVTLTNDATQVNMIGAGGSGSSGPSLTYVTGSGASGSANVAREGDTYTITGTAIAVIDDPERPLLKPFKIVATAKCRQSMNQAPATVRP
jgi:Mycobacterium 19 kDa lipoprotein antigen